MRFLLSLCLFATVSHAQEAELAAPVENPRQFARTDNGRGDDISGVVLSPDGARVALYGVDWGDPNLPDRKRKGKVQIWDVKSRNMLLDCVGHTDAVQRVRWSNDGRMLASQSQDGVLLLWNTQTGKPLQQLAPALQMPSFGRRGEGETIAPEVLLQQMKNSYERPALLGFSADDRQVLAITAKADLPPSPAPKEGEKPAKSRNIADYVTPVLRAWNVADGKIARNVPFGKAGSFHNSVALSADGRSLIVNKYGVQEGQETEKQVEIRDLQTGALQSSIPATEPFNYPISLSADGSRVLMVNWANRKFDQNRAQIWDVTGQKPLQVLAAENTNFARAKFSQDNRKLLVSGKAGAIAIFDLESGKLERSLSGGHCSEVSSMQLTPDGTVLLSLGEGDSRVQMWDLTLPDSQAPMPRAIAQVWNARRVQFAPDSSFWTGNSVRDYKERRTADGIHIEGESGKSVELRHYASDGKELETISMPEKRIADNLTFSPDFKLVAATLSTQPEPAYREGAGVGIWDIATQKLLWHLPGDKFMMDELAWSPDSKTLVVGRHGGGPVQLWSMETGKLIRVLLDPKSAVYALRFASDGETLAIGTQGGSILLFDMVANAVRGEITEDASVSELSFSPDGKHLLSGGNIVINGDTFHPVACKVRVWNVDKAEIVREWETPKRIFGGAAWSPDGKMVAIDHFKTYERRDEAKVELYEVAREKPIAILSDICGAERPIFAPDGKTLLTIDGQWIKSWNVAALKP